MKGGFSSPRIQTIAAEIQPYLRQLLLYQAITTSVAVSKRNTKKTTHRS